MKYLSRVLTVTLLILPTVLFSKEIKYKFADIPNELKENARSVIRNQEVVLEVRSTSTATINFTCAITILNKNGLEDAFFKEFHNKFRKISGIKGRVFDENGEQIKRIPSDEILDYSAISGYSTYEDNRVKFFDPKVRNFPFTLEYSYEQKFDGLFSYPAWYPQPQFNIAVEKSSYKAIIPKDMTFRYLERNLTSKVILSSDAANNIYYWEAKNLKAKEWEPYSMSSEEILPCMIAAPADFEIDNYKGNLNSWENFGKFISTLNEGKDVLDDETRKLLNDRVKDVSDTYGKIRTVYEYMQSRTRYVSIQVGIGSWQPFDAASVQRLSYGDCKALANYMKTLLQSIGIKSNYCLVYAGKSASNIIRDFPSSQFNHAFLCVPDKNDTIWLECTSQRVPCGFIGSFTDDRDILLIDKDKSKVIHSKAYKIEENMILNNSLVKVDENGKGSAKINTLYKGLKYEDILPTLLADDTDKKRLISERLKFPTFQLLDFKFKEIKSALPSIEETVNVNFENYLTNMGSRYLLKLNISNKSKDAPYSLRSRKTDVYIKRPSMENDTIIYELSSGLKPEFLPKPVVIKTQFGSYESKVERTNNQLCYTRVLRLYKGVYHASEYSAFVDFYDQITAADEMKCTLITNADKN